jgi:CPA2 family monovalent cation:H+ antiporter-2
VVLLRALEARHQLQSLNGRIAVGWLVVEDLVVVLVLVLLPALASMLGGRAEVAAGQENLGLTLGVTLGKVAAFIALMLVVAKRLLPRLLWAVARTGSRELFTLSIITAAVGIAYAAAELFSVSFALGAFFAGMMLSGSPLSQRAAEESLPLRDAFALLFFLSVGMLFNPRVLLSDPLAVAATLLIVLGGGVAAFLLLRRFGVRINAALTIAVSLAQIGEFSFIMADLGIGLGILEEKARDLILGASILSIFLNPLLFALVARRQASPKAAEPGEPKPAPEPTTLSGHAVLVGYGRVGRLIADGLKAAMPVLVIEEGAVNDPGVEHIRGNAAREDVLAAAGLARARFLFVAIPQAFEAGQIVEQARKANPALPIVARAHFDGEVEHLLSHGASQVVMGEREIALAMLDFANSRPVPA